MSDYLRIQLERVIGDAYDYDAPTFDPETNAVMALLADPANRPAIFEAMGLESPPYVLRHRGSDWMLVRPRVESSGG